MLKDDGAVIIYPHCKVRIEVAKRRRIFISISKKITIDLQQISG